MVTLTALEVHDIRFPTSEGMHGSDAMHPDPDYSAAYVVIKTSQPSLEGHGLTFTIGRGNEIVKAAVEALSFLTVGKTLEGITAAFGEWWKSLVNDGQLRWLGPEKGVMQMAVGALVNAVWDLWGKVEGKPVWRLLYDMSPEQLVSLIDFRWITDAVTPDEALAMFTAQRVDREERLAYLLKHGYRAYTTSAGWLGYTEQELREKCRSGVAEGWTHFKAKVGVSLEEDKARLQIIRDEIGDRTLMVDANQRWDVPQAIAYMKELAQFKPWFIEEPTCADDVLGHLAIKNALKPYNIAVATGEVAANRVMFKQFIMSGAMDICQIDSCRVAGVNEILAILLIAAKYKIPVCPHAGGVGLCEYVQHLAMFDYLCVSGRQNIIEYVNHLHEHFKYPVVMREGCYTAPADSGYSIEMFPHSIADYTYPTGKEWQKRLTDKSSRYYKTAEPSGHAAAGNNDGAAHAAAVAAATLPALATTAGATSVAASDVPVWLITGAQGFVGGWVIKALLDEYGSRVSIVAHDVRQDDHILSQILTPAELASLTRVFCDVSKSAEVAAMVATARPTHIIHLAGLQIPTCRANPPLGAAVNVVGTVNIFNAAVQLKSVYPDHPVRNIIYASSAAAYGPATDYPADSAAPEEYNHKPRTQYGVYKLANEGNARVYWQDHRLPSVGLRMMTVFGVGREVGMTSGPTKAVKSALLGRGSYEIGVKGETSFNDVRDVARLFVESAKRCTEGAIACGVRGVVASVEQFMQTAEKVVPELKGKYTITANAAPLPFPSQFEEKNLATLLGGSVPVSSLEDSIAAMANHFRKLQAEGRLSAKDLE